MESDRFSSNAVYIMFMYEYLFHNNGNTTWAEFLRYKDLGIVCLGSSNYRIQDKKKWMLAKIKYGI